MRAQTQPPTVKHDSIWLDTVKQGDIVLRVRGRGVITSNQTAELRVAETQVRDITAGQAVTIAFQRRPETMTGTVTQVRPGVTNGTVGVDVQVPGTLPAGIAARTQVDGAITIGSITNVVYVGRPVFGRANSEVTIFKIEPDGQTAVRVPVQLGQTSINTIQIKSGLQPGDKIILSDMSAYDGYDRIVLR